MCDSIEEAPHKKHARYYVLDSDCKREEFLQTHQVLHLQLQVLTINHLLAIAGWHIHLHGSRSDGQQGWRQVCCSDRLSFERAPNKIMGDKAVSTST